MKKKSGAILVIGLLLALGVMVLAGCGKSYPYGTGGPGFTELKTPVVAAANPAELPADFNKIEMGMTTEQVKQLVGYPATIQDIEGKRVYKYYVNDGKNRLYVNFMDNKVESMTLSTP